MPKCQHPTEFDACFVRMNAQDTTQDTSTPSSKSSAPGASTAGVVESKTHDSDDSEEDELDLRRYLI